MNRESSKQQSNALLCDLDHDLAARSAPQVIECLYRFIKPTHLVALVDLAANRPDIFDPQPPANRD